MNEGVPECPIQLKEMFQPALKPELESAWNTIISHMLHSGSQETNHFEGKCGVGAQHLFQMAFRNIKVWFLLSIQSTKKSSG